MYHPNGLPFFVFKYNGPVRTGYIAICAKDEQLGREVVLSILGSQPRGDDKAWAVECIGGCETDQVCVVFIQNGFKDE